MRIVAGWRQAAGEYLSLRTLVLIPLLFPALLALYDALTGGLGPRPYNEAIHRSGWWTVVFLLASLLVTPLKRGLRWARLISIRRRVGLAAFFYAAGHLVLYAGQEKWNIPHVATEIAVRLYLTIGFVALLGLAALAATSTDAMLKRLGGRKWRRLHQLVYPIGILAMIHFFQQSKLDVTQPTLFAGLLAWLLIYRLIHARRTAQSEIPAIGLVGLAVGTALLTAAGEAVGIGLQLGVNPLLILQANLDFALTIRPGWWVLGAGLTFAAACWARRRFGRSDSSSAGRPRRRREGLEVAEVFAAPARAGR